MSLFATLSRSVALTVMLVVTSSTALAQLEPTEEQRQAAVEIADSLRYGHYAEVSFDQAWSKEAFDRYLDILDGQRAYLLSSDIEPYRHLETDLAETLFEGELDEVFALYDRLSERHTARLEWLLERLDDDTTFNFDGDERLELEREDTAWAENESELESLWEKRLKNDALTLALTDQDDEQIVDNLRQRYEGQLSRLEQTESEDVFGLVMAAVTGTIDPHTSYLSPRQGESFDIQMSLSLEGIGALLQADGEYVKVSSLVPGGPAERAGVLEPADRIIGVGQEDGEMVNVIGMRLDNVVDLIRGPKGSVVKLDVVPAQAVDMTRSQTVEITRDTVDLEDQAAQSEVIDVERDGTTHRLGVIEIPTFYVDFDAWQAGEDDYRSTTRDVAKEIEHLKSQDIEGIVLDLRNNGGGALQEANSLIGLFIDRGPTVQVRDADGRINLYGDSEAGTLYDGPMGVLVNRLSASASEILAGAIQDYGRGIVMGSSTFGKGTVQTLSDLNHGEIKLTRAKFYRISGESTQNRGVEPDIDFPSLLDPERIGESSLDNALEWDTVQDVQYRRYGEPERYLDTLLSAHEERAADNPNFRYLEQQSALSRELREQNTSVSLNREQRERETEAQEAEQLSLENQRRRALGLDELEEWTDARDETPLSDNAAEDDTSNGNEDDDNEDDMPVERAHVLEAAEVLLDYAQLQNAQRYVNR
ncbi:MULTISPECIES: carboxy terminal-processing peptidase [unclassified Halomonas]|uniref:carboxy terminal-processing peptidase n=1 Tax=unclassified Halomonas TaxID=2609666 RepID=UPI0006DAE59A|nr:MULTISPECIES: carboxy terminal-processing peptidase [unclassified Halomonas]KPQ27116.1 MAG: carboxyl-terminal processing protease [Halomonas sp. HL-93]SBR47565.1 C-terminal processing peptidase-1. Serine peptidase. MEROPS family S41A [Halomonas sp. HL-93]SNY99276.1 C-terminal processing peptidase-1. Serine peptidase. MEROPS family S41A [Halomonas sp. hl-4]